MSYLELLVDTGAMYTCCNYSCINADLYEKDFSNAEYKVLGGFVDGNEVASKFYRYPVKQFTIGNIDLGERDIWITFDERVTDAVLGTDILESIDYVHMKNSYRILFFKDYNEMLDYINNPADLAASYNDYIRNR